MALKLLPRALGEMEEGQKTRTLSGRLNCATNPVSFSYRLPRWSRSRNGFVHRFKTKTSPLHRCAVCQQMEFECRPSACISVEQIERGSETISCLWSQRLKTVFKSATHVQSTALSPDSGVVQTGGARKSVTSTRQKPLNSINTTYRLEWRAQPYELLATLHTFFSTLRTRSSRGCAARPRRRRTRASSC